MKCIQNLDLRSNGTRNYRWALFECPICLKHIERMKHQGKVQQYCRTCARKIQKEKVTSHGDRYTRLYRTWVNMKARCFNKNEPKYNTYGARGITVCSEWKNYLKFKEWAINNGYNDSLTIDRKDVNGNYEPDNCQFISNSENASKDRISISYKQYKDIVALIAAGTPVAKAYTKLGFSRTAYYNAKKRYANV